MVCADVITGYATGSHPIIMRRRDTIAAVVLALRAPLPRSVPHRYDADHTGTASDCLIARRGPT
jgi:hypothetical protein